MPPQQQDRLYSPISDSAYRPLPVVVPLGGAAPDTPQDQLPENQLVSALNFLVRGGFVKQRDGYNSLIGGSGNPQSDVLSLFEFTLYNGSSIVVAATPTKFYYFDTAGSQWVDITTTARTGTYSNPVFFNYMRTSTSGVRIIAVNGADAPAVWGGDTNSAFIYLTTAVIGQCAAVWRSHFLQADTTDTADGQVRPRVHWSALGDPTVWSGTASAGSLDLFDENATKVMTMVPLRNSLLAYKEKGVHNLVYKASPFYFTQQLVHPHLGIISRKSVVPILNGDSHFVFTKEGVIIWDGQSVQPIGRNRVDRTLFNNLNWSARDTCWCAWWPETQEVFLGVPWSTSTSANRVWVYNLNYDSWWETDLPFKTMEAIYNLYSTPRLFGSGNAAARVWHIFGGASDTTASTAIQASLQTGLFDYAMGEHKELLKVAVNAGPGSGNTTTFSVQKAATENPVPALTFASAQAVTVTAGSTLQPKIDFRLTGRWIAYYLTHTAGGETLELRSLVPYITARGDARIRRS